jgi:hypothetical protein
MGLPIMENGSTYCITVCSATFPSFHVLYPYFLFNHTQDHASSNHVGIAETVGFEVCNRKLLSPIKEAAKIPSCSNCLAHGTWARHLLQLEVVAVLFRGDSGFLGKRDCLHTAQCLFPPSSVITTVKTSPRLTLFNPTLKCRLARRHGGQRKKGRASTVEFCRVSLISVMKSFKHAPIDKQSPTVSGRTV